MLSDRLRLLIVDDQNIRYSLKENLEMKYDYIVDTAADPEQAMKYVTASEGRYDVVIVDEVLRAGDKGIGLLSRIKSKYPFIEVIIMSAHGKEPSFEALSRGAFAFVEKPFPSGFDLTVWMAAIQARLQIVSQEVLSTAHESYVLDTIINAAKSFTRADFAAIAKYDTKLRKFSLYPDDSAIARSEVGRNVVETIFESQEPMTADCVSIVGADEGKVEESANRRFIGVPVSGHNAGIGVLCICGHSRNLLGVGICISILSKLAAHAGLAIANSTASTLLAKYSRDMESLVDVGKSLIRAKTVDEQSMLAWRFVKEQLQVSTFFIGIYDGDSQTIIYPICYDKDASITVTSEKITRLHNLEPKSLTGYVFSSVEDVIWQTSDDRIALCQKLNIQPRQIGEPSESSICVPLIGEHGVMGVACVQSYVPYAFDNMAENAFRSLVSHLATSIEIRVLIEQKEKRAQEMSALAEFAKNIHSAASPQAILHQAVDCCQKLVHPDTSTALVEIAADTYVQEGTIQVKPRVNGYTRKIIDGGIIVNVKDLPKNVDANPDVVSLGIRSMLGVRIQGQDYGVKGALFVHSMRTNAFSQHEENLLAVLADRTSLALSNSNLHSSLTRRANILEVLHAAATEVTSTLVLDDILDKLVEVAYILTRQSPRRTGGFCQISMVHGDKLEFRTAYPRDHLESLRRKIGLISLDIETEQAEKLGITGLAVLKGAPQRVNNVRRNKHYISYEPTTNSELAVPVMFKGTILGVISNEHPDLNAFTDADQMILEILASHAASAIRNANQFQDLKDARLQVGALTSLAWVGMVSSSWYHGLVQTSAVIRDTVELLNAKLQDSSLSIEEIEFYLREIANKTKDIVDIPIVAPLDEEHGVEAIKIVSWIDNFCERLRSLSKYSDIDIIFAPELDSRAVIRASREWLRRALRVVIDNAARAMATTDKKSITIRIYRRESYARIEIEDTGTGISNEVLENLFTRKISHSPGEHGLGIGLLMTQTILNTYGGNIQVQSTTNQGTNIAIELPIEETD